MEETSLEDYEGLKSKIVEMVLHTKSKAVKEVVEELKKVLLQKRGTGMQKLRALNLLNACLTLTHNQFFILSVEQSLLSKLSAFARFKKESSDPARGALLFGKKGNTNHAELFLKYLLIYIRDWAHTYPTLNSIASKVETILSEADQQKS